MITKELLGREIADAFDKESIEEIYLMLSKGAKAHGLTMFQIIDIASQMYIADEIKQISRKQKLSVAYESIIIYYKNEIERYKDRRVIYEKRISGATEEKIKVDQQINFYKKLLDIKLQSIGVKAAIVKQFCQYSEEQTEVNTRK